MIWVIGFSLICAYVAYFVLQVPELMVQRKTIYLALVDFNKKNPRARDWVLSISTKFPYDDSQRLSTYLNPFDARNWQNQCDVMVPHDQMGTAFRKGFVMATD